MVLKRCCAYTTVILSYDADDADDDDDDHSAGPFFVGQMRLVTCNRLFVATDRHEIAVDQIRDKNQEIL